MAAICSSFAFNNEDFSDRVIRFVETHPFDSVGQKRKPHDQHEPGASKKSKVLKTTELVAQVGSLDPTDWKATMPPDSGIGFAHTEECYVSRVLLASRSAYFKTLFSQKGFAEKEQKQIQIDVNIGEASLCMELVQFVYNGCQEYFPSNFSLDQLIAILLLADRFVIPTAVSAVVNTIRDFPITSQHCMQLLKLPESLLSSTELSPLVQTVGDTLHSTFGDFDTTFFTREFVKLSAEAVVAVISHDNLKLCSENTVWQALQFWSQLPVGKPRGFQAIFIPHIRFASMDIDFLLNAVIDSPDYKRFPELQNCVARAAAFQAVRHPGRKKLIQQEGGKAFRSRARYICNQFTTVKMSVDKQTVLNARPGKPNVKINDIIIAHQRVFANGYSFLGIIYRVICQDGKDVLVLYLRCEACTQTGNLFLPLKLRILVGRLQSTSEITLTAKHPLQLISLANWVDLNDGYFVDDKFNVTLNLQFNS